MTVTTNDCQQQTTPYTEIPETLFPDITLRDFLPINQWTPNTSSEYWVLPEAQDTENQDNKPLISGKYTGVIRTKDSDGNLLSEHNIELEAPSGNTLQDTRRNYEKFLLDNVVRWEQEDPKNNLSKIKTITISIENEEKTDSLTTTKSIFPKYITDGSTGRNYFNESKGFIRFKCALLTVGTIPVHIVTSICNLFYRIFKLVTFKNSTLTDAGKDFLRMIASASGIAIVSLELAALYGLLRPHDGRKLYATIERAVYADDMYLFGHNRLAPCFQPDPKKHLFGGDPDQPNQL